MARLISILFVFQILLAAAAPVVGRSQDDFSSESECHGFGHCWQAGDQVYQLPNHIVTHSLLTLDDIRTLSKYDPLGDPHPAVDGQIQLASYTERSTEETDGAKDFKAAKQPSIAGATVYASKSIPELREILSKHKATITSDTQQTDAVRASRLQILSSANEAILKTNEYVGNQIAFENQIIDFAESDSTLRQKLEEVVEADSPSVDDVTNSETLARQLKERREKLAEKKSNLQDLENQIQFHSERVTQIPIDRADANERLQKVREKIAKRATESDDMESQLTLILQELKIRAADAELKKLDSEVNLQEGGAKIFPIRRDLFSREVKRLETEITRWEVVAKRLRKNEVQEEQRVASQAAEKAHWSLSPLAERNEALVDERKTVGESLQTLKTERKKTTDQIESIIRRRSEIENKITAAGLTGTNGMLLVDLRRNLTTTSESHIRIRQLQAELRRLSLSKVGLNEERDELADPAGAVKKLVRIGESNELFDKAVNFVETKRDYLDLLIDDFQSYGREVSEVSQSRKKLIDEINKTLAYIDENALWIRSADPVGLSNFRMAKQGVKQFFDSNQWIELALETQQRAVQQPHELTIATLSLVVLLGTKRRVRQKLQPTEETDEQST